MADLSFMSGRGAQWRAPKTEITSVYDKMSYGNRFFQGPGMVHLLLQARALAGAFVSGCRGQQNVEREMR